jgi:hypothetical protein
MHVAQFDSLGKKEYDQIVKYYSENAPARIAYYSPSIHDSITIFDFVPSGLDRKLISMIRYDSLRNKIYVGDGMGWLYTLNKNLVQEDSIKLPTSPVAMVVDGRANYALCIGSMMPRDEETGTLVTYDKDRNVDILIDSLRRPVYLRSLDENNTEFLISAFGNTAGSLATYKIQGKSSVKTVLDPQPGAMKTVQIDWDKDGRNDILALMAQGDERLMLFRNTGDGYKGEILLRFPPIYGSSSFELADFNGDNQPDILFTAGDNGDFSTFVKPYHGLRIFINTNGKLDEKWFHPMPGARDTRVADFDGDGDGDIAAISFFPDNLNSPLQNFIYLENQGNLKFKPAIHSMSENGKWLVMEMVDLEDDGDQDLLLGSFQFSGLGYNYRVDPKDQVSFMLLRNKTK